MISALLDSESELWVIIYVLGRQTIQRVLEVAASCNAGPTTAPWGLQRGKRLPLDVPGSQGGPPVEVEFGLEVE